MTLTAPSAPPLPDLSDPASFNARALALFVWQNTVYIPWLEGLAGVTDDGEINGVPIGQTAPAAGGFTTLEASSLGLGTASPAHLIDAQGTGGEVAIRVKNTDAGGADPDAVLNIDAGNANGEATLEFLKGGVPEARVTALGGNMRLVHDTGDLEFNPGGSGLVTMTADGALDVDDGSQGRITLTGNRSSNTSPFGIIEGINDLNNGAYRPKVAFHRYGTHDDNARVMITSVVSSGTVENVFVFDDAFKPDADNSSNLGSSGGRWAEFYCANPTINTSDENLKTNRRGLTAAELSVADAIRGDICIYQWIDAVENKGVGGARLHTGLIAQKVAQRFEEAGLDPERYSLFTKDVHYRKEMQTQTVEVQATETVQVEKVVIDVQNDVAVRRVVTEDVERRVYELIPVVDENGAPVVKQQGEDVDGNPILVPVMHRNPVMTEVEEQVEVEVEDGYRYGLRYSELLCFLLAGTIGA